MGIILVDDIEEDKYMGDEAYVYWNDEEIEKRKVYYLDSLSQEEWQRGIEYAEKTGILSDLREMLKGVKKHGNGISIACGTCCDANVICYESQPAEVTFLDYSKIRIHKIAPILIEKMGIDEKIAIRLVHGDYYNINCEDATYDFVVMSMALMMAMEPDRLMVEVKRILKRGGGVVS